MEHTYDENRLIELLAEGTLSCRRIARKLGISGETVRKIDRGEARADLQHRINQALRARLREGRRGGRTWAATTKRKDEAPHVQEDTSSRAQDDTGTRCESRCLSDRQNGGQAPPANDAGESQSPILPPDDAPDAPEEEPSPSRQRKPYDENLLVELLAQGYAPREAAHRVGLNEDYVRRIARGKARVDLYERLREITADHRRQTHHLLLHALKGLMARQIKEALHGDGAEARRAREFLINKALSLGDLPPAPRDDETPAEDTADVVNESSGEDSAEEEVELDEYGRRETVEITSHKYTPEEIDPPITKPTILCMNPNPCEWITARYTMFGYEVPPFNPDDPPSCGGPTPCEHAKVDRESLRWIHPDFREEYKDLYEQQQVPIDENLGGADKRD